VRADDTLAAVKDAFAGQTPATKERMREGGRIRVIVVNDHKVMREGLRSMLQLEPDILIVGEAEVANRRSSWPASFSPMSFLWISRCRAWEVSRQPESSVATCRTLR